MSKKCANVASHVLQPLWQATTTVDNDQQGIKSFKLVQQHCVAIFAFLFNWQDTGGSNTRSAVAPAVRAARHKEA